MDRRVRTFINNLEKRCLENKVELLLVKDDSVKYDDETSCTGYFDIDHEGTNNVVLACAIGDQSSTYISTLVHESCHMDQWLEDASIWKNHSSCGVVDLWIDGTNVKNIKKHLSNVRDLELDCEKRTIKKIGQFDLPINTKEYIQKANAYVHLYNYIETTRKWTFAPYKDERVWTNLPDRFREKRYYNTISPKVYKLFTSCDPHHNSLKRTL